MPELIAVRDEEPRAVIISRIGGAPLERLRLSAAQEMEIWREAGQALIALHGLEEGPFFGPCSRDGSPAETPIQSPCEFAANALDRWFVRGIEANRFDATETSLIRTVRSLASAFGDERPAPCHGDFCPANWLISDKGRLVGFIDFEMAHWDLRISDLTRLPSWEWMHRPDLTAAFLDGYGRQQSEAFRHQLLFGYTTYAVSAVVWGEKRRANGPGSARNDDLIAGRTPGYGRSTATLSIAS